MGRNEQGRGIDWGGFGVVIFGVKLLSGSGSIMMRARDEVCLVG